MWKEKEEKPIAMYLGLTFAITWMTEAIIILIEKMNLFSTTVTQVVAMLLIAVFAALAPGISVYLLLRQHGKISGLKDYLKRVFACESKKSLVAGLALTFFYMAVFVICTEEQVPGRPWYIAPFMLLFMIPGGGWEELGWRGFLQPALEEKFGFVSATVIMGAIWSIWHFPLWFIESASQKNFEFWAFSLYCVALSFLLAAAYKMTKSVIVPILLHAWANTMCGGIYTYRVLEYGPSVKGCLFFLGMILLACLINAYYNENKN